MPGEPSIRSLHINQAMTNFSVALFNDSSEFMSTFILPSMSVPKFSDLYWEYNSADFLRDDVQLRGPGGEYAEVGYTVSTSSYFLVEYALASAVPDEQRDNSDSPLQPDADAITLLTEKFQIASERRTSNLVMSTANITQNQTLSGVNKWTDYANSTPVENIWTARRAIRKAILRKPNRIAMGEDVWEVSLVNHPQFIERIKYTERATPDRQMQAMKDLFMVQDIRSSGAIYNASNKGVATVYNDIWGDDLLIFYNAGAPSLRSQAFGWTLTLNGNGPVIRTKRDDLRDRDVHQAKHIVQEKIINNTAAYLFKDTN